MNSNEKINFIIEVNKKEKDKDNKEKVTKYVGNVEVNKDDVNNEKEVNTDKITFKKVGDDKTVEEFKITGKPKGTLNGYILENVKIKDKDNDKEVEGVTLASVKSKEWRYYGVGIVILITLVIGGLLVWWIISSRKDEKEEEEL